MQDNEEVQCNVGGMLTVQALTDAADDVMESTPQTLQITIGYGSMVLLLLLAYHYVCTEQSVRVYSALRNLMPTSQESDPI